MNKNLNWNTETWTEFQVQIRILIKGYIIMYMLTRESKVKILRSETKNMTYKTNDWEKQRIMT